MNSARLLLCLLLLVTVSCFNNNKDEIVASVNEQDLLISEIINQMPIGTKDSVFFIQQYKNNWIRKKLLNYNAEINLRSDLIDYEKQIEEYKSSLLIYTYKQQLLNQNFDTTISDLEIEEYYNKNRNEFNINRNIFKGRYIVVDKLAPKLKSLSRWYKSDNKDKVKKLNNYCKQFAKEYYLDDSEWQYFSRIDDKIRELISDEKYFLRNTKGVWFEDEFSRYYIYIKDYQINGSISPLSIEREKIRNVLLNKKKLSFFAKLEDELYQNALNRGKIKIY